MTVNVAFSPTLHTHRVNIIPQAMFTLAQERRNLQFKGYGFKQKVIYQQKLISDIQLNVQVSVSYSVQCTWCTAPGRKLTSSPSPSLLRYSTVLYSPVISSVHSLLSFPPERTSLFYIFTLRDGVHMIACRVLFWAWGSQA